ncbi:antirestriction protein ArdA [Oscillatoria sp. FACHB-1407]|uniref:antirestriction protein ArdA n=1 Tax=Oscillatoria sp. FACHB-1407 TaxID=2692847 RepID=UPI0016851BA3|nr:antirestriction protein ArdA [Oscillatoria sp. FACHB-1407]MBD2462286.1 antirestriction protein ArdA [Oscillatoria sp. FACHB-1407]
MSNPSIYVACLASYNAGKLYGVHIEFVEGLTPDEVQFAIDTMLKKSPVPDAEEWEIHDSEGFAGFSSNNLDLLCEVATLIHQHGEGAVKGFIGHAGAEMLDEFSTLYCGCFKSEADFCQAHLGEEGGICEAATSIQVFDWATLDQYIDWEAIANDAFINSYYSYEESYETVHVYGRQ